MEKLLTLELENFQSLEKSTRINFAPITLLYGPNSAGKSAVYDALELIASVWNPEMLDSKRAGQLVDRWARRGTNKDSTDDRWLRLAVEFELEAIDPDETPIISLEDFFYCLSQLGKRVRLDIKLVGTSRSIL